MVSFVNRLLELYQLLTDLSTVFLKKIKYMQYHYTMRLISIKNQQKPLNVIVNIVIKRCFYTLFYCYIIISVFLINCNCF